MIDYLVQNLWLSWLLVGIICLILEIMNGDFFIMCFAPKYLLCAPYSIEISASGGGPSG